MKLFGEIKIGRILGVEITLDYSWFIIFVLIIYSFGLGVLPRLSPGLSTTEYVLWGILGSLLFFFSILFHEMCHTLVARRHGIPVAKITLFIFGGASNISREPSSARDEFTMAIVGPLASLVLGGVFLLLYFLINRGQSPSAIGSLLYLLGVVNISLGVFNLLPGFPLDGGRVFRSIVWSITNNLLLATKIASIVGDIIAFGMVGLGIFEIFTINFLNGIWLIFIGLFLYGASNSSYGQTQLASALDKIPVANIKKYCLKEADASTGALNYLAQLSYASCRFAILMRSGQPVGIVDLRSIQTENLNEDTPLADFAVPVKKIKNIQLSARASQILEILRPDDLPLILVVDGDRPVGVLTLDDIQDLVQKNTEIKQGG